jgi:hypothetical protein
MKIEPFTIAHYDALEADEKQGDLAFYFTREEAEALVGSDAYAAIASDGRVVAIGGFVQMWPGRAGTWALMSSNVGMAFRGVHMAVKRGIEMNENRRIEMTVDCDYSEGCRWAEKLGFKVEGRLIAYGPDGKDHYSYALVRPWL